MRDDLYPKLETGVFLLTLDTELAWGGLHNGSFRQRAQMYDATRSAIHRLLGLAEEYGICATWAVVGHLFLESCAAVNGVKHPELVRPTYTWFSGDWLESDPCSDAHRSPHWYGPDIIESILGCRSPQELGSHSFSHVIVRDPGCSRECFDSELKASIAAATEWGVTLRSFVYPRDEVGHLDVLAANGFTVFRGRFSGWSERVKGPLGKAARGAQWTLPIPPLTAYPRRRSGMWDLPATSFYLHRDGFAGSLPTWMRVWRAVSGVRKAIAEKSLFHLYFHPFNLATDPEGLLSGLASLFDFVARQRERGVLINPSMGTLAEQLSASSVAVSQAP